MCGERGWGRWRGPLRLRMARRQCRSIPNGGYHTWPRVYRATPATADRDNLRYMTPTTAANGVHPPDMPNRPAPDTCTPRYHWPLPPSVPHDQFYTPPRDTTRPLRKLLSNGNQTLRHPPPARVESTHSSRMHHSASRSASPRTLYQTVARVFASRSSTSDDSGATEPCVYHVLEWA